MKKTRPDRTEQSSTGPGRVGTTSSPHEDNRKLRVSSRRRPGASKRLSEQRRDRSEPRCGTAKGRPKLQSRRKPTGRPTFENLGGKGISRVQINSCFLRRR